MTDRRKILVLGAGGVMGRLIVDLLQADHPDMEVISASRHPPQGLRLSHRRLDLAAPDSFPAVLNDIDVLIHAAGPFHHDPRPLVHACLDSGTHYVDIAEDLDFIERVGEAARAHPAAQTAVVPGCSTVPGLVALLSQRFEPLDGLSSVQVFLSLGSRNPVSQGLLAGLLAPLGLPLAQGGRCFRGLRGRVHDDGIKRYYGAYPIPFRDGLSLGDRHFPVRFFTGFDRYYINLALWGASYIMPHCSRTRLAWMVDRLLPLAAFCRRFGKEEGHLVVEGHDSAGRVLGVVEVVARREGLKLPAAPAVWAATRLVAGEREAPTGLCALHALLSAGEAIQWIRAHGYEVHEQPAV